MADQDVIDLDEQMASDINGAYDSGKPVIVTYVDAEGYPHISYRGTAQVYSADQLAVWIRDLEGGLLSSLSERPQLTFMYRDHENRRSYILYGTGRVEDDEAARKKVFETSPVREQERDPERRGKAVIVDVAKVEAFREGERIVMRRA